MDQNKEVIYVPFWIAGMLERNNLPLSTVLDFRKISQYLSAQEQANMLLFQNFNPFTSNFQDGRHQPTYGEMSRRGTDITEQLPCAPLTSAWRDGLCNSTDANDKELLNSLNNVNAISWATLAKQEVSMRFDPANCSHVAIEEPFITYDVEREFVLVVVYPAFFDSAKFSDNVFLLCKAVLKVLYVHNSYTSGCKTPYFRKYLESLS